MRVRLSLGPPVVAAWFLLSPSIAGAQAARPTMHRVLLEGGVSPTLTSKPDYGGVWNLGLGLRAAYFFRPISHVDIGANFTFWGVSDIGSIYIPCFAVRGYVPLSSSEDPPELGFNLYVGPSIGTYYDATWLGTSLGLGPDFRIPLAGATSLQISAEAAIVGGDYRGPTNYDLLNKWKPVLAAGGWSASFFLFEHVRDTDSPRSSGGGRSHRRARFRNLGDQRINDTGERCADDGGHPKEPELRHRPIADEESGPVLRAGLTETFVTGIPMR